jgi:hypothetical protein
MYVCIVLTMDSYWSEMFHKSIWLNASNLDFIVICHDIILSLRQILGRGVKLFVRGHVIES